MYDTVRLIVAFSLHVCTRLQSRAILHNSILGVHLGVIVTRAKFQWEI
jgi:hypothetical protein